MKKFLAVLLAVALLGVAGAAFAADAGHSYVDPTTGKTVEVDTKELATAAEKLVKAPTTDEIEKALGTAATSVDVSTPTTTSTDKVAKYAAKAQVVAVALPALSLKDAAGVDSVDVAIKVSFDKSYAGKTVSPDMNAKELASSQVTLAAIDTPYFEAADGTKNKVPSSEPYTMTLKATLKKGYTYEPVALIAVADVADVDAFKSTVKTYSDKLSTAELEGLANALGIESKDLHEFADADVVAVTQSDDSKAVLAIGKVTANENGYYARKANFKTLYSAAKENAKMTLDVDGTSVKVAAIDASSATFFKSDYKTSSDVVFNDSGYVTFKVAGAPVTHKLAVTAEKKTSTTDPTSSKGSGGCNGGFAGIAVLALGLAALRRKAR